MLAGWKLGLVMWLAAAAGATAQPYQPPRTAEGRPDLQGVWVSRWTTPLERSPEWTPLVLAPDDGARLHAAVLARLGATDPLGPEYAWDLTGPLTIDGGLRSSLVVDPADGRLPYSEDGARRRAAFRPFSGADGPEQRGLNERCLMAGNGYAPFLSIPAANIRQIVQTTDTVLFHTESFNQLRIIPTDGRTGPMIPRGGSSSGHWEGDVLVVETARFLDTDRFRVSPLSTFPISPLTRITERFARVSADEISYRFTVEDPGLYTRAWTAESMLKRSDDPMFEWACHEGNYGLANILRGARVGEERALRKKGKP
jgi:hypothetical protein